MFAFFIWFGPSLRATMVRASTIEEPSRRVDPSPVNHGWRDGDYSPGASRGSSPAEHHTVANKHVWIWGHTASLLKICKRNKHAFLPNYPAQMLLPRALLWAVHQSHWQVLHNTGQQNNWAWKTQQMRREPLLQFNPTGKWHSFSKKKIHKYRSSQRYLKTDSWANWAVNQTISDCPCGNWKQCMKTAMATH